MPMSVVNEEMDEEPVQTPRAPALAAWTYGTASVGLDLNLLVRRAAPCLQVSLRSQQLLASTSTHLSIQFSRGGS